MNQDRLRRLIETLENGEVDIDEVLEKLRMLPYEDIGYAKLDHHRSIRRGFPEAIFCTGKTTEQVLEIADRILSNQGEVVLTKVGSELASELKARFQEKVTHASEANMAFLGNCSQKVDGKVAVVTAGTSDISVAEEAAALCDRYGVEVSRIYDVGVAGVHRLIPYVPAINASDVVIVIAGMEGALPSIVSGLTDKPVIAVPTSIGYGANFRGLAALLGMLCTCSPGIAVVNIDNGFGAAVFALSILRIAHSKKNG